MSDAISVPAIGGDAFSGSSIGSPLTAGSFGLGSGMFGGFGGGMGGMFAPGAGTMSGFPNMELTGPIGGLAKNSEVSAITGTALSPFGNFAGIGVEGGLDLSGLQATKGIGADGSVTGVKTSGAGAVASDASLQNPFTNPAGAAAKAADAPAAPKSTLADASPKVADTTKGPVAADKAAAETKIEQKPIKTELVTDAKEKANAHMIAEKDAKGNVSVKWNEGKELKPGENLKIYMDPSIAKNEANLKSAMDQAQQLANAKHMKLEIPNEQALKDIAKQSKEGKTIGDKKPNTPQDKKPVPDGGGGKGGGGTAPPKKDNVPKPNRDTDNNGGGHKTSDSVPKSFKDSGQFISDHGGVNHGTYANYINAVYGKVPGFSGLMSEFDEIDKDDSLSPAEKAAKKAKLMAKFQDEHKTEIQANAKEFANQADNPMIKDSIPGLNDIGNKLADSKFAENISNILSQKDKATDTDLNAVFDSAGKQAVQNLAQFKKGQADGANWDNKDKAQKDKLAKIQAKIAAELVGKPYVFSGK